MVKVYINVCAFKKPEFSSEPVPDLMRNLFVFDEILNQVQDDVEKGKGIKRIG